MRALLLAVFCSGGASLIYQVCWTRRLSDVTSATAYAQALVLAVFFTGLALGAWAAGSVAARLRRPLLAYAAIELSALVAALLSLPAFRACELVRTLATGAGVAPSVTFALELGLASALMLVPTTLLGASLPFVLEACQRSAVEARRVVGLLYGINTLGAACGAALAGFVLIERVGLARAVALGSLLSLAAAVLALVAARQQAAVAPSPARAAAPSAPLGAGWLSAAAVGGFVCVGAEVVWTRLFSLVVLNTVYAFTQVLLAVLIGIAAGAWLAERLVAQARGQPSNILRSAAITQASAAFAFACIPPLCLLLAGRTELEGDIAAARSPLGASLLTLALAVPVMLNAALLPMLVYAVGRAQTARSFGSLYAANTAGSVAGSVACGFALIPALGSMGASVGLEAMSLLLAAALLWASGKHRRRAPALVVSASGALLVLLYQLYPDVPRRIYEARIPASSRVLELREGVSSVVMVTEAEQTGQRRLWINSSWVAGTGGGHSALGHLPALFVERPRRALGIALGTGQTFAAMLANGVTKLDVVEINPDVIRLSRRWFGDANEHLFERAQVQLHQDDGRAFLRATRQEFDLIVLEPLQAWSVGTSSLYSLEFYQEARARLAAGGLMAQWIPLYGQGVEETRSMVATAARVFPQASLWLDEHDGILLLRERAELVAPTLLDVRLVERGLSADLARKSLASSLDLLGLLVLGPRGVSAWTQGAPLITDDRPFLEFAAARSLGTPSFAPILRSLTTARDARRSEAASVAGDSPLAEQADVLSRALVAEAVTASHDYQARAGLLEPAMARVPKSALLRLRYRKVMEAWGRGLAQRGAKADLETILRRGVEHDPDYGEAALNLAVLALRRGDAAEARRWAEHAVKVERVRGRAEQLLAHLAR